jgi:hypothetical protein
MWHLAQAAPLVSLSKLVGSSVEADSHATKMAFSFVWQTLLPNPAHQLLSA